MDVVSNTSVSPSLHFLRVYPDVIRNCSCCIVWEVRTAPAICRVSFHNLPEMITNHHFQPFGANHSYLLLFSESVATISGKIQFTEDWVVTFWPASQPINEKERIMFSHFHLFACVGGRLYLSFMWDTRWARWARVGRLIMSASWIMSIAVWCN